jgi:hypothetical protein
MRACTPAYGSGKSGRLSFSGPPTLKPPVIGDLASPTDDRTTRQNDGHRHPGRSAKRHLGSARNAGSPVMFGCPLRQSRAVDMPGCQERLSFDVAGADGSLWRACESSHSGSSALNNGSPSRRTGAPAFGVPGPLWATARCRPYFVKLKLDLHEIYNRGDDIDRALRASSRRRLRRGFG